MSTRARRAVITTLAVLALPVLIIGASLVYLFGVPDPNASDGGLRSGTPPTEPPYVADTTRVERVADSLRDLPLYVDPLAEGPRTGLDAVAERVADSDIPVYVAVLHMGGEDESDGEPELFAHALHHVLGEDGIYLVVHPSAYDVQMVAVPFGYALDLTGQYEISSPDLVEPTAAEALMEALDTIEDTPGIVPDGSSPEPDPFLFEEPVPARLPEYLSNMLPALLLGSVLCSLVFGVGLLVRMTARAVSRARSDKEKRPTVPAHPGRRRLERIADEETAALNAAVGQAGPDHPRMPQAMAALDAALLVRAEEPDELDLVGVIVLLRGAREQLDRRSVRPRPVCMNHPLHGSTTEKRRKIPGVGNVYLCADCMNLTKAERERRALRVSDGTSVVPHHTLDRVWVRAQYGVRGAPLAEQVLEELGVH
ncbi:hypothetical protein GCM10027294_44000 [Marinactinospora endophytica]